ncbi:TPR-repeat-containing protein [Streptococcus sp. DD10]|uniref:tetratricopeptide repeat protein n=1 Tax=Streptococcus sp. DD10 TaxID=1777878 RepID=UPI000791659C|nr:tetratricopeptide repeat protein [Streptococcus sp. DD10]KXT74110.1 TPR-repeat-containing protein [Streptococcus sp. DD10]
MTNSEQMLLALEEQDLEKAESSLNRALQEDDDLVLWELAQYLEGIGFYPQAKQIFKQLLPLFPEANLSLASIAAEDGDMELAFGYLECISQESDFYLNSLLMKADFYQMEGLADVAREKLVEAAQLSDDSLIIFGLAEIDFELGNFQTAIKEYASLDNREIYDVTGISTYQRIGVAYASLGKFEVAIDFLEKAVELEFDDETVYELATLLYDQEEYQRANIYFKQLDTISPDFEGYEYPYAQSLHEEHLLEEALAMIKKGIAKNPFDTHLLLLASQFSYELHDEEAAENYLLEAAEQAEDIEEIALRLTNLYLEQKRFAEVVEFDNLELDNVLTKWNIGRSYYALEQVEKANSLYKELLEDLKDNPEFLENYIYLLRENGQLEEAKVQAEHYLSMVPDAIHIQEFLNSM